jgi:hypothetical protein
MLNDNENVLCIDCRISKYMAAVTGFTSKHVSTTRECNNEEWCFLCSLCRYKSRVSYLGTGTVQEPRQKLLPEDW